MKCKLFIRTGPDSLLEFSRHDSYGDALRHGQAEYHGNFLIESKYPPTRETQLGLAEDEYLKPSKAQKEKAKREALAKD